MVLYPFFNLLSSASLIVFHLRHTMLVEPDVFLNALSRMYDDSKASGGSVTVSMKRRTLVHLQGKTDGSRVLPRRPPFPVLSPSSTHNRHRLAVAESILALPGARMCMILPSAHAPIQHTIHTLSLIRTQNHHNHCPPRQPAPPPPFPFPRRRQAGHEVKPQGAHGGEDEEDGWGWGGRRGGA